MGAVYQVRDRVTGEVISAHHDKKVAMEKLGAGYDVAEVWNGVITNVKRQGPGYAFNLEHEHFREYRRKGHMP